MTSRQRKILEVLAESDGEMYGLDLIAAGAASRRTLYVELGRLEDLGWIEGREETSSETRWAPRQLYRITPRGATLLLPTARTVP